MGLLTQVGKELNDMTEAPKSINLGVAKWGQDVKAQIPSLIIPWSL